MSQFCWCHLDMLLWFFCGLCWWCYFKNLSHSSDSFVDFVGGVILRTWVTQVILLRTLLALFLYAQASSILRWWAIVSGKASSKLGALLWFLCLTFSNLLHMAGWGLRPRLGIWALSLLGVVLPLDVGPLFVFLPFPSRLVLFLDWTCFIFKNKNLIHSSFFQSFLPFVLEKAKGTQNQPDFIVAQVFQIFPSFTPGERQGKTESAILYCCTFISSWRKTREQKLAGLYCCTVNDFFVAKQTFEKYPTWKTVC